MKSRFGNMTFNDCIIGVAVATIATATTFAVKSGVEKIKDAIASKGGNTRGR